jgi:hypothetical protein
MWWFSVGADGTSTSVCSGFWVVLGSIPDGITTVPEGQEENVLRGQQFTAGLSSPLGILGVGRCAPSSPCIRLNLKVFGRMTDFMVSL